MRVENVSSPSDRLSVAVVVLNWNGLETTLRCLKSLEQIQDSRVTVVVVDNGSTDGSGEALRSACSQYKWAFLGLDKNYGYAGGNNAGIRFALDQGFSHVFVLNNDTYIDKGAMERLLAAASTCGDTVFGPVLIEDGGSERVAFAGARWNTGRLHFDFIGEGEKLGEDDISDVTDYVCGAALLASRKVFENVGVFDERFFLTWEDSDWCFRVRAAGFRMRMVPDCRILHGVASSFGGERSPMREYFSLRNRMLWLEKHGSWGERTRVLSRAIHKALPKPPQRKGGAGVRGLFWAAREYSVSWQSPTYRARRLALRDYWLRRFGDCPGQIRGENIRWRKRRRGRAGGT